MKTYQIGAESKDTNIVTTINLREKTLVCITGDIDDFKKETIDECLKPYFAVLKEFNVNATIAITAKAIQDYPGRADFVLKQGHELAIHGDIHQAFYGAVDDQINRLEKAKLVFKRHFGFIPRGFRAPSLQYNRNTYRALVKTGFLYDSSHYRTEVPLRVPIVKPSFINRFSYDWRMFRLAKPLLKPVARFRYYRSPAKPFILQGGLIELPVTGPDDYYLIANDRGPKYSPSKASRIAEIWLDILFDIKKRKDKLFVALIHPLRTSPLYIDAMRMFISGLLGDNTVEVRSLKEVAESLWNKR
jgi:hypothetical protein